MAVNRLAVLGITVDPTKAIAGSRRANAAIAGVGRAASNVKNRIFSLQGALVALGGGVVIRSFLRTASSMENLKIQLKTVTGSANDADKAFSRLTDFTTRTPYEIDQVVSAFTKLKAFGLDPSEEAMTAFGNTAAAMGKDLNQMIEAVADAATGEFERLKEFGIKSKQQGDQVSFTFQGVTTTIKKESEAIQGYLMDIGNNQFGGAMSDQMDTMSGALSNFRGSFTLFQDELMNNGPFAIFKGLINSASEVLFGAKGSLSSNAAEAGKSITSFIQRATIGVARFTDDMQKYIDAIWGSVSGLWSEFLKLPSEVQSVGIVGVMLGGFKLRAFTIGVLGSISTIKKMLGMSNIDDAMLGSLEKINAEILRIETSQAKLMDANALGGGLLGNLNEQLQILYDAKLALKGLSIAGEPLEPTGRSPGKIPVTQSMGDNEKSVINFFNLQSSLQAELNSTEEGAAAKKVRVASASMGEISALHRNAQREMSDATAHFEARNADLHAAAMARKSEAYNQFKSSFNEGWAEMEAQSMPVLDRMADKLLSIFGPGGTFSQGIGDATANMIIFGKSGADSMKELGRTIMGQVISALVAMGVQTAVNFAKERVFGAAGTAAAVVQGGLIAAAYAPAAAAVSLATLGANAVSANVGMASSFALAKGLSLTGARELGGPVQRSGTYLVGERGPELFTPGQSGSITSNKDTNSGGNTANVTFNINAIDTSDATRLLVSQRGTIIGVINQALNERGRAAIV
tara:strand:- start:1266 stop:3503 length:2238 start_codon:yes stop_codon:yes gene_type:complete